MNEIELRTQLQTLLIDDLGYYTFANGAGVAPAIVVQDMNEIISDRTVSGLEVVIFRVPQSAPKTVYGGVQRIRTWQIYLKQWDGDRTLQSAIDKIEQTFPGVRAIPIPVKEAEFKQLVSVKLLDQTSYSPAISTNAE